MSAAEACEREPIHIPGAIQPHGCLLVLSSDGERVLQASANVEDVLGLELGPGTPAQAPAVALNGAEIASACRAGKQPVQQSLCRGGKKLHVTASASPQGLLVELERLGPADEQADSTVLPLMRELFEAIEYADDPIRACRSVADETRRITGFNRVLVYRFDENWNGTVEAESNDGALPSYLGLHFPASDIPARARELHRLNRLRLIPDVDYTPVPITPELSPIDGAPLDLSMVGIRSVSPVHLEYMRNMGTAASMSISLLVDGRLWGLISCHHAVPRLVGPRTRAVCDLLGRLLSQQIGARLRMRQAVRRVELKRIESQLLTRMAESEQFQAGLKAMPSAWLELTDAAGAAIVSQQEVLSAGSTPTEAQIRGIAEWLRMRHIATVFHTDSLAAAMPGAEAFAGKASGLLAIPISQIHASYMMWFRPEMIRTVSWGGDPRKPFSAEGDRLSPRRSFELWTEQVRLRAAPWGTAEIEAARDFGAAIGKFVLRHAEQRAELTEELERSNRELEAFSYSVSHDLRAPFRHIVGYAELLAEREASLDPTARHYLQSIIESAQAAGRLVDDLLNFSRLSRTPLERMQVDMRKLFAEVWHGVLQGEPDRKVEWRLHELPPAWADPVLLRQAVLNLLSNALKYTRGREPAVIEVSGEDRPTETVYSVRDNGVGFDMTYIGKLFGVFQRLHRMDEFEGTGIGLALTKRIIDRHNGWIRAESAVGDGATFSFGLPKRGAQRG